MYHSHSLKLSDGQKAKLAKAHSTKTAVTLRLKYENLRGHDELFLTKTQINKIRKKLGEQKGMDLTISKTQILKVIPQGGSLATSLIDLARPLLKPGLKALASGGLSFGVEKALGGIFGSGVWGSNEAKQMIKLNDLLGKCPPHHLEPLVRQVGTGTTQKGGFLGALAASIGIPMAIDLVKKLIGSGVHVAPPQGKGRGIRVRPAAKGMQINPPPFYGTWPEKRGAGKKSRNS